MNKIYTIGFTGKTAKYFFNLLQKSIANRIIDIRLNNKSQLSGFAKKEDLVFFLKTILNWNYEYRPELAPTKELLDEYKKNNSWEIYENKYNNLICERDIINILKPENFINGVLLCSEHEPQYCHRRLIAELFAKQWGNIEIIHLL